jgi:hypothetical protein
MARFEADVGIVARTFERIRKSSKVQEFKSSKAQKLESLRA